MTEQGGSLGNDFVNSQIATHELVGILQNLGASLHADMKTTKISTNGSIKPFMLKSVELIPSGKSCSYPRSAPGMTAQSVCVAHSPQIAIARR